jgi:hypothetical protein
MFTADEQGCQHRHILVVPGKGDIARQVEQRQLAVALSVTASRV